MNRKNLAQRVVNLALVMLLSGCGSQLPGPTPTPTPLPGPEIGHWEGQPSVSFDITSEGTIRDFKITIPMGLDKCLISLEKEIVVEEDGTFLIGEIDSDGALQANSIRGEFDSAATINGTYSKNWLCQSQFTFSTEEGTWSAEWKGP